MHLFWRFVDSLNEIMFYVAQSTQNRSLRICSCMPANLVASTDIINLITAHVMMDSNGPLKQ